MADGESNEAETDGRFVTESVRRYQERMRLQCLAWAQGRPYHEPIDNECCPDFSCCMPEMFEQDAEKRWQYYRENYGVNS